MILTIFGATGMVGKYLVMQALQKGHSVKAFSRNVYTAINNENKNLQLIQGALFDENQVYNAIRGSDAILSALGGASDGTDKSRSLGMKNIVDQMEKAGVKRIIAIGNMGSLDAGDDEDILMAKPGYPAQFLAVGKEHYKAFEFLKASSLDWTFVCPPDLIDGGPTGIYHIAANHLPVPNNFKINAGDLALFMLNELNKNEFTRLRVGISN